MIHFAHPSLLLFALVPASIFLWRLSRRPSWRFSSLSLLLAPAVRSVRQRVAWLPDLLEVVWWLLLATALARPQMLVWSAADVEELPGVFFLLDVSGSMATVDSGARGLSRLERLKPLIRDLMEPPATQQTEVKVGLIAFSKLPRVVCPLTTDAEAAQALLEPLQVDVLENRTNIGDAIGLAMAQLQSSNTPRGAVIVFSDGAHNVEAALTPGQAARAAQAVQVPVYCVGLGAGGTDGESTLDERTLQQTAEVTGGEYFHVWEPSELQAAAATLKQRLETTRPARSLAYVDVTKEVLLAALGCLFLGCLLRATWLRVVPEA